MYRISIIIPCYKVEKYLRRCLDSLLHQTLDGVELICINDGSPDNRLSILREYKEKYGERIVIIDKKNEGVWKARKDGIKAAKGEYIAFVDPDDYVSRDYAKLLYAAAKKHDADIAVCGFDRVDEESGKAYSREMTSFPYTTFDIRKEPGLLTEVNTALWNKLFRASVIKKMGELECIPGVLDDMMFAQLIYINAGVVAFVKRSLIRYMVRRDSVMNTVDASLVPGVYKAMRELHAIYKKDAPELDEYLQAAAFLHLCISFTYRLSADKKLDLRKTMHKNEAFMDKEFPGWRRNSYIGIKYSLSHRKANLKLSVMRLIYGLKLFGPFLAVYKYMIGTLKKDIKW